MANAGLGLRRRKITGVIGALTVALLIWGWTPGTAAAQGRGKKSSKSSSAAREMKQAASMAPKPYEGEISEAGRRDPFKLPPPPSKGNEETAGITGPLPPGKKGLLIGQLRLEGVVREDKTNTMIAVVTNSTNRAYFLHENDELYNGVVSKITPDSVYFTENTKQANGNISTREVVKKLGTGSGEGK